MSSHRLWRLECAHVKRGLKIVNGPIDLTYPCYTWLEMKPTSRWMEGLNSFHLMGFVNLTNTWKCVLELVAHSNSIHVETHTKHSM